MIVFGDLVRAGHDLSAALLFGAFLFPLAIARPALRAAAEPAALGTFDRLLDRTVAFGLGLMVVTGVLWLWVTAAGMADVPLGQALTGAVLGPTIVATRFGAVSQGRVVLLILLAALAGLGRLRPKLRSAGWFETTGLLLSGGLLAAIGLGGHADAEPGTARLWHLGADMIHLLGAGAWLGTLPLLVAVLGHARRAGAPAWLAVAGGVATRFSTLGIVSVGAIVASGLVNTWYTVGTIPALLGTEYGWLLLVKLALFATMLGFAAANRLGETPRLHMAAAQGEVARAALDRLIRNAAIESALGLLVLLAVGALVALTPAAHEQPVWPFPVTLNAHGVVLTPHDWLMIGASAVAALLGLVAIGYGVRRRRWLPPIAGTVVIAAGIALAVQPYVVEAYPTSYVHSPARYTANSIARGEPLFAANCAACHGRYGYGDGPLAASLDVRPANLTQAHLFHHGEGTLFWWISHGIAGTPMPAFADRLDPNQRWDLLNFLHAQAEAELAGGMSSTVEPFYPVAAPDFAFQLEGRRQETLRGQRGKAVVVIVLYTLPGSLARLRALAAAAPRFAAAGARIVALPMAEPAKPGDLGQAAPPILADPNPAAVATYTLYRRSTVEGVLPLPQHMELLVDRSGYLRARWIPDEIEPGWATIPALLHQIDILNREPPRPPAGGTAHVHH